ncbi:4316_t:CDS:2 [Gigaspora margarita]|uniref:4316_t:CDS:1 n=1 Tax=Gigaspora margarita TaxID=4874 RepID=A0ABN7UE17_GIGMA|nr:4316_t:CDS:2 [Gigaspora margarita]
MYKKKTKRIQLEKTSLNNEQKKEIIEFKNKNPNISHVDLATWVKEKFTLEVHSTTIGHLIKNKDNIGDDPFKKRQRTVHYPDLENTLLEWYESGKDDKLNVLNAIKFIVRAWKEVSPETIRNCFRHTEILPVQNNKEPTDDENDDELIEEMEADIEAFNFQNAMDLEA